MVIATQFRALFEDASKREFDVVLVWALDASPAGMYETFALHPPANFTCPNYEPGRRVDDRDRRLDLT